MRILESEGSPSARVRILAAGDSFLMPGSFHLYSTTTTTTTTTTTINTSTAVSPAFPIHCNL
ncbi:hypothetical protein E2C01_015094 [Portunus trituberculatus]|uniref:Uncharacterized protein n=1 Tax=Portunus trituberculatus TaxID=210409 RepID=A0A5B7DKW7_PORTR|nr:hypothetical protein [Portunus trituberculatus]